MMPEQKIANQHSKLTPGGTGYLSVPQQLEG